MMLSILPRHTWECVPDPVSHLGQPIVAPNLLTMSAVMYNMRPLAVMVFATSISEGCVPCACGTSVAVAAAGAEGEAKPGAAPAAETESGATAGNTAVAAARTVVYVPTGISLLRP